MFQSLDKYLKVKRSSLPGSGKGLFTTIFIPRGTIIAEHTGKISSFKDADHDGGNNPYLFYVSSKHVIDGKYAPTSFARFINDARGHKKIAGITNNSKYLLIGKRVFIEAIKDIQPNEEIFVSYGREYWDTAKRNSIVKQPLEI